MKIAPKKLFCLALAVSAAPFFFSCTGPVPKASIEHGMRISISGEKLPVKERYAGNTVCRECHGDFYSFWAGTAHARSLNSLESTGQDDEPSCLRCHTTGYGVVSGYDKVPGSDLASVGCEACHGPSAGHAGSPGKVRTAGEIEAGCPPCTINEVCRFCHTPFKDPGFTPGEDFDKVRCSQAVRQGSGTEK